MRRTLYAIWTWLVMTLVSACGFVIVGTMRLLIWPFDKKRLITGRAIRIVAICIVKCNPVWRFSVHGNVPKKLPERCICISNHCSHTDPFLMSHLPWEMKWLAKSGLFRIPFVGWGMRLAGDIPLVRGSAKSAKAAMERCRRYVEQGVPVMIFPEGTRATGAEMLPFKDGAFSLALRTGADLLPMAVAGTSTALRKGDWRPDYSRGIVTVGEPISTRGLTQADLKDLKERARREIERLRETIRPLVERAGADSRR